MFSTASKPCLSTRRNLHRILDDKFSSLKKQQRGSYETESKLATEYLDVAFVSDRATYMSVEQRIGWSISESHEFRPHLNLMYNRITTARHLECRIPTEECMRFACRSNNLAVLKAQLRAGYGPNAFIHESCPQNKAKPEWFTTPLIESSCFPTLVTLLIQSGADINKPNGKGLRPVEAALTRLRYAEKKSVYNASWRTRFEVENLPNTIEVYLFMGCKRPRAALLHDTLVQNCIRELARRRWRRVRTLAYRVAYAVDALKKLLVHIRYMPGGSFEKAIRTNWDDSCKRQRVCETKLVEGPIQ